MNARPFLWTVLCSGLLISHSGASLVFNSFAGQTLDFDSFDGSGFAPSPAAGQLDSDTWRVGGFSDGSGAFGGTHTTGDFARGTDPDAVSTGGVYSFEVATGDFSLGVQPGGTDFTPGTITLKGQNNTGTIVSQVSVAYDVVVYNDAARGNTFNFEYSLDDSSYNAVSALDFTSPAAADGSPAWVSTSLSTTITGLSILAGEFFYLQWAGNDSVGGGSRDQFAINNLTLSVAPEPSTFLPLLAILAAGVFGHRRRKPDAAA